ncbi:Protein spinster-like protein 1 [Aphelenchoides besseyi]|nr:Protein spinster-like protein 1 [Aphelenchoides besseyi]
MNGSERNGEKFDEISLNNTPLPTISHATANGGKTSRRKSGRMTAEDYISVGVLFAVNLLNYMDRFTVAAVLNDVQAYYHINDQEGGFLQTVFIIAFMIFAPICGYLGDRHNRKWIMVVGLSIWVTAVLASSFVPPNLFFLFATLRGVVGIGEASYSILAPTIIADMFTNAIRSRVLMFFYFAIPVGSGLGFGVGSTVSGLFSDWRWGIRVTPILGVICIAAIVVFITEPERGKAEKAQGAENVDHLTASSYWQDLLYLAKNKTFIWSTIGYTSVVFVTGTLSWWSPTAVEHATAAKHNLTSFDQLKVEEKASISLIFGAIFCISGVLGVSSGTIWAHAWKRGRYCFRRNIRADPIVSAIGSAVAVPFLFLGLHLITVNMLGAWISIFVAVTFLCLNWAVNVDLLLYIIVPKKRSVATGVQILISHLFGDASGPYIVGLISDSIRGDDNSPLAHFESLLTAFYLPISLLIVSAIAFGISAWTLLGDKHKFDLAMGYKTKDGRVTIINGKHTGLENGAFDTKNI